MLAARGVAASGDRGEATAALTLMGKRFSGPVILRGLLGVGGGGIAGRVVPVSSLTGGSWCCWRSWRIFNGDSSLPERIREPGRAECATAGPAPAAAGFSWSSFAWGMNGELSPSSLLTVSRVEEWVVNVRTS
jgi:hypothetical protein